MGKNSGQDVSVTGVLSHPPTQPWPQALANIAFAFVQGCNPIASLHLYKLMG